MVGRETTGALIPRFYAGRNIFITGGSGFMGKVLVERLLSTCPDIYRLYLLLRSKKDVLPEKRLEKLKLSPVFDLLRQRDPSQLDKLYVVPGDVEEFNLGMSPASVEQLKDVSIVFHSAATLKFDEELNKAVDQNIRSVISVMQICDALPKIEAFIYVSTAYSNPERSVVEERVYSPPAPLRRVLALTELLPADQLAAITDKIISPKPNTYTFTKAMAETAVEEHGGMKYPIAIFRPTIVISSMRHPFPGWLENLNGPSGIIVAAGKGLMHVFRADCTAKADLLPVDIAIDTLIAVGWETAVDKLPDVRVYNCTVGENPTTWGEFKSKVRRNVRSHPLDGAMWYPCGIVVNSTFAQKLFETLYQTLPLHVAQYIIQVIGIKLKINLITASKMLSSMNEIFKFFSMREWDFKNGRVQKLRSRLTADDAAIYNLDPRTIDWDDQYKNFVKGTRKYLLKEKEQNLPEAKQHIRKLWCLHNGLKLILMLLVLRILLQNKTIQLIVYGAVKFMISFFSSIFALQSSASS